jgi:hypothetical protein
MRVAVRMVGDVISDRVVRNVDGETVKGLEPRR